MSRVVGTVDALALGGSDESDLDITSAVQKSIDLDDYLDDVAAQTSSRSDADSRKKRRIWTHAQEAPVKGGERVQWSDSDDPEATYNAFKNRKSIKRRQVAKQAKATSMVGKRAMKKSRSTDTLKRNNTYGTDSESEDKLLDQELPDYIKQRKSDFDKTRQRMGEYGLKIPPDYKDIVFSDDERLANLKEKPVLAGAAPCAPYRDIELPYSAGTIPAPLAQWLRSYQVEGAAFLHEMFVYQRGGILGDDMGLGKTIQVIAFLTAAFGKTADERDRKRMRKLRRVDAAWYPRILIICPSTLMQNWRNELMTWGWWEVYVFHGSPDLKAEALAAAAKGRLEIMITTYDTYRGSMSAINTIDWDCVIADECHKIKGRSSEITRAMNEINALCRIGLTGTAIQNNYEELWTLLNWSNPGRFGAVSSWKQCISEPLKLGQAHDATVNELSTARRTAKKLVGRLLPQFFLRRMKSLIAHQLPVKRDSIVFCPLTETQAAAYERVVNSETIEVIRTSAEMCPCGSGRKRGWCCNMFLADDSRWQSHVFPAIVTLQKLANHLALLIPSGNDPQEKQIKDLETLQLALPNQWRDLYRERDSKLHCADQEFCGKWKILKRLLHFWYTNPGQSPNKVLVFSHSVRLLRMLQDLFKSKTSYNVSYLDGSTRLEDRQKIVDDFNADDEQFVFLISTRAGGVGLNITSANKVVVVDPNWNPSYDLQAQDRAYRIGQTRNVDVFRLVSAGTIEEIVYARQIYKQQQANIGYNASLERRYFRGVQDRKEKKGEIFGLENLFAYQGDNVVLRDIVNKTNVAESKAGVVVANITKDPEPDDPETTEDAAMSQLAAMIMGDDKGEKQEHKTDAVQAILASAGVSYSHENSEVVGTSTIESRLSRRAIERGNDIDTIKEHVFESQPSSSHRIRDKDRRQYHPPEDVRRRQFCSMAKHFGFDTTQFALVVESWTQAQRRNCLEQFYQARHEALAPEQDMSEEEL